MAATNSQIAIRKSLLSRKILLTDGLRRFFSEPSGGTLPQSRPLRAYTKEAQ